MKLCLVNHRRQTCYFTTILIKDVCIFVSQSLRLHEVIYAYGLRSCTCTCLVPIQNIMSKFQLLYRNQFSISNKSTNLPSVAHSLMIMVLDMQVHIKDPLIKTILWIRHLKVRQSVHDDVMKWKRFPHYWPFVDSLQKASDVSLCKLLNKQSRGRWIKIFLW